MAINLYDVMTERRRAFRDMFSAMKEWAEPTEREKMAQQHIMDMEKMSEQAKINLNADMIKMTRAFGETMALRGIDFDNEIMRMGITAYEDRLKADMKWERDLELAKLDIQARKDAARKIVEKKEEDIRLEEEKENQAAYQQYIGGASTRSQFLLTERFKSETVEGYDPDLRGTAWKEFAAEVFIGGGTTAAAGAGIGWMFGGVGAGPGALIGLVGGIGKGGWDFWAHREERLFDEERFGWERMSPLELGLSDLETTQSNKEIRKKLTMKVEKKIITQEEMDDITMRLQHQKLNVEAYTSKYISSFVPIPREDGSTVSEQKISSYMSLIDLGMAQDHEWMHPFIGTEKLAENKAYKLQLNAAKKAQDGSTVWANFREIETILNGDLSEANLAIIEVIADKKTYNALASVRNKLVASHGMYKDYFERANGFLDKEELKGLANFKQIEIVVNQPKLTTTVHIP